ncbi:MAG: DUF2871 domain-containing protein [Eubacterium sp.]
MKKLINTAFVYAILGMIGGVFFREFTKFNGFTGRTTLGVVHLHLFVLGMIFFLIIALFNKDYHLVAHKNFNVFYGVYNAGIGVAVLMFLTRGIVQVLGTPLSKGLSAAISGVSGIGHIMIAIGIILFFTILKKQLQSFEGTHNLN